MTRNLAKSFAVVALAVAAAGAHAATAFGGARDPYTEGARSTDIYTDGARTADVYTDGTRNADPYYDGAHA